MIEHYQQDKSTIFSIVPFTIREFKPGLYPGEFKIEACLNDAVPTRLVIGASEHLMHTPDAKPLRVVTPSFVIAEAVVRDFLDGQLWSDSEVHPGISWLQGDISLSKFLTERKEQFESMKKAQLAWFVRLCQKTDDEWTKYQNSRVASDQARFAAKFLGLEPIWLTAEIAGFRDSPCPACGTRNNPQNAVCSNCRCVLDEAKYKTLKFANA